MNRIALYLIIIACTSKTATAQLNGYSLEFEDVITLSADSDVVITGGQGSVSWSRSYTIPAGQVLKITGGWLMAGGLSLTTHFSYQSFISTNNQKFYGIPAGPTPDVTVGSPTIYKITHDSPIWITGGQTVSLTMSVEATAGTITGSMTGTIPKGNWITGVVFKKVPN